MNTLIVNLTRFGDLLQTQPTITGLGEQGRTVGLVCLENFAAAAGLLDGLALVRPLPGAALLARCDQDWRGALAGVRAWTRDLVEAFRPQTVINLTPSLPARLLTRLLAQNLPARHCLGFLVDEHGFGLYSSPWAAFLQLAAGLRGASPFNVADLFRRAAGLTGEGLRFALRRPGTEVLQSLRARLETARPPGTRAFAAFQLGASEDRRRWPVDSFRDLGRQLWEQMGICPVLLGSGPEKDLGRRFADQGPPCVNLIGETGPAELAAALTLVRLLVTNDTGTMHLAAGLSTPVLALFLATAQPWDTGPCQEGALCLEPDLDCHPCAFGRACHRDLECRRAVRPGEVFALVRGFLETGAWPDAHGLGPRVWLTRRDPDGLMTLESLSGHGQDDRGAWMALQRALLGRFLDKNPLVAQGPAPSFTPGTAATLAGVFREASGLLELAEQQAALLGVHPREALKAKFLATCRRVEAVLGADPRTAALAGLWAYESQAQASGVAALAALAARYRTLALAFAAALPA